MNKNVIDLNDFLGKCESEVVGGATKIIASLTDKFIVDIWPTEKFSDLISDDKKVLEIRVFNQTEERRLFRSDISKPFVERKINDSAHEEDYAEYYDEIQFIDIDGNLSKNHNNNGIVVATGGGEYPLPVATTENVKIRVRYYLDKYSETGQAYVKDWRLVELKEGN